jgi:adenylate cyclase
MEQIRQGNYEAILRQIPRMDIHFFRFLAYFYISGIMFNFLKGMRMRMGRMNFIRWFFGILSKPREEERIFMFLDMKSSTSIAEKLLHKKFSYLVQDVFNSMSVFGFITAKYIISGRWSNNLMAGKKRFTGFQYT